ncbi:hypothetical protein BM613_09775 [Sulfoacidibacillus thermotolerans]|uniref:Uncharacterized protein n=1 Tax=Sulfoacidibacillus thermotolerans TaxID=1765684 RepID=A0A2U3D7F1_SULT2|nr:hypothetical protein BM613_09775 [Sulfoacidibacillus thermotolerans]
MLIRPLGDLDLFTISKERKVVQELLETIGLKGDREFNLLNGKTRLLYYANHEKVDVFIDEFSLCHRIDLRERIHLEAQTLPLADLLLTKLQIVELNRKDMIDLVALLLVAPLVETDQPSAINIRYLAKMLAKDWGLWRTCTKNLQLLVNEMCTLIADEMQQSKVLEKINTLQQAIDLTPKSAAWRMRSVVGERVRWYELPEEP